MKHSGVAAFFVRIALVLGLSTALSSGLHAQTREEPRTLGGNVYFAGGNQPAETSPSSCTPAKGA